MTRIALKDSSLHLRNAHTRMPFRYGSASLTACPQAILRVVVERGGKSQQGFSGDALPPGWFDKRPEIPYCRQIADQIAVIDSARRSFAQSETTFAEIWRRAYEDVHALAAARGLPPLLASFGHSLVERAIIDALCRLDGVSFHGAARHGLFGIEPGSVLRELDGLTFTEWLPQIPAARIFVRHTVGLIDPLTPDEIPQADRLQDGLPHSFREYVEQCGLQYFKIKVSNRLDDDLERLKLIASVIESVRGDAYALTLDGNEQYRSADDFAALVDSIQRAPELNTLWNNVLAIEQPLHRSVAMTTEHTSGIRELGQSKPVIIDESDDTLDAFSNALDIGYRGVSSKACKGPIKSLANAGLCWLRNDHGTRNNVLMTGEDLTCAGMVSLQTDLALVATLGLTHVERNGHHYYRGLSYLPESHQREIAAAHPDLYEDRGGTICARVEQGALNIASLQCAGFGFAIAPSLGGTELAENWRFESLGLDEAAP